MNQIPLGTRLDKDQHLIKQAFSNYNSFKRFMTLAEIEAEKGNREEAMKMELQKYKYLARLELSLRALQKEIRHSDSEEE